MKKNFKVKETLQIDLKRYCVLAALRRMILIIGCKF